VTELDEVERQRRFYATRDHGHLQAQVDDLHARTLAESVVARLGIGPQDRVLEVGAGFGRFSFHLLESCASLVALDLSERALETLTRERDARGIAEARCRTEVADLQRLEEAEPGEGFDHVVGFYILHHLSDYRASIAQLARRLRPGGRMGFLEPNRWNPLFALQIMCCRDMSWHEEKGLFRLSRTTLEQAFREGGLGELQIHRFGFFPPPIFNRFSAARSLERHLESVRAVRGLLPFLLVSGRRETAATR